MLTRLFSPKNLKDIACELVGSFLAAVAIYNFALNAEFLMTGFSGISLILYRLFGLPIGALTVVMNIPVAIWCYKLLGRDFFLRSIRCTIFSSLMVDYVAPLLPLYSGDRLLTALFTGVLGGIGYALIFMRNSSTGGSDFIIMAIRKKHPHYSLGRISFMLDFVVLLAGGIIFRDFDGILYGLVINYITAQVMDKLVYGVDAGKLTLIITDHSKRVVEAIDRVSERGATIIPARGGYAGQEKEVVLCACNNKQMHLIRAAVHEVDPAAFTIILESNEVLGEGFKPHVLK